MFEIIGLLIATAVFMLLATCVGSVYALIAWLILPRKARRRRTCIAGAFVIPVFSAIYLWGCAAALPGSSLFGDIDQPLPNGFALTGLAKMPEYSYIKSGQSTMAFQGVGGSVDMLAVNGPLVAGRYCQSCDAAFVQSKKPYFVLDTRTAQATDYPDLSTLQTRVGQPVNLVESQYFRSQEQRYLRQQRNDSYIMFTPPIFLTILYFCILFSVRLRESRRERNHLY